MEPASSSAQYTFPSRASSSLWSTWSPALAGRSPSQPQGPFCLQLGTPKLLWAQRGMKRIVQGHKTDCRPLDVQKDELVLYFSLWIVFSLRPLYSVCASPFTTFRVSWPRWTLPLQGREVSQPHLGMARHACWYMLAGSSFSPRVLSWCCMSSLSSRVWLTHTPWIHLIIFCAPPLIALSATAAPLWSLWSQFLNT